ncbi:hypothetical protein Q5P01_014383 [Channa striata]|uniref:Uncharacterized protein n=1 Tax=Channa striata TaxID=64152 RepID=A0AA88SGN3_CHASR|nr:hypothetical protein Q5P01_014383 [Channa striata]
MREVADKEKDQEQELIWEAEEDHPGDNRDLHSLTAGSVGTVTWDRGRVLLLAAIAANSRSWHITNLPQVQLMGFIPSTL